MAQHSTKTFTKGDVIVEEIKVGDIHYEFGYGCHIKCEVLTEPVLNEHGQWEWKSKNVLNEKEINYLVTPGMSHYGPNLYNNLAYTGTTQV